MRCAAIICCSRVSRTLTRANSAATKNAFAAISKTTATMRSRANVTMKLKSYHRREGGKPDLPGLRPDQNYPSARQLSVLRISYGQVRANQRNPIDSARIRGYHIDVAG